jgi:hypothetical protein
MATNGNGTASTESRGEYGNVPLTEEEDIVQLKKAQSTSTAPTGWANHPGMSNTFFSSLIAVALDRLMSSFSCPYCDAALPVVCYCLASIMMTVINKVRILRFAYGGNLHLMLRVTPSTSYPARIST